MQQNQDIKGFTLLELLVVIAIVSVISAVAYPNFMSWSKEREVRSATEKVASMIANIATQTQRGSFSYSQLMIVVPPKKSAVFFTKAMGDRTFSEIINSGKTPTCKMTRDGHWDKFNDDETELVGLKFKDYYQVYNPEKGIDSTEIAVQFVLESAICFGRGGKYYKATNSLSKSTNLNITIEGTSTPNYIIICSLDNASKNGGSCPRKAPKLEKPAYLVKWSRFGNVSKYKWNGSDWNRQ